MIYINTANTGKNPKQNYEINLQAPISKTPSKQGKRPTQRQNRRSGANRRSPNNTLRDLALLTVGVGGAALALRKPNRLNIEVKPNINATANPTLNNPVEVVGTETARQAQKPRPQIIKVPR
jgi:hypothetical protein